MVNDHLRYIISTGVANFNVFQIKTLLAGLSFVKCLLICGTTFQY